MSSPGFRRFQIQFEKLALERGLSLSAIQLSAKEDTIFECYIQGLTVDKAVTSVIRYQNKAAQLKK